MQSLSELKWIDLKSSIDSRGILTSIESELDIPIEIKRIFYMHHVNSDRGGHAHIETDQIIIALSGMFEIELYDGKEKISFLLNDPTKGLYVPRLIFINLFNFSKDAVCLVLANTHYDMKKSIRNIEDYNHKISSDK